MRQSLVEFSVKHPKLVLGIALVLTFAAMAQMPRMRMDTNPKNTLAENAPVRVWNREVDRTFALYADTIVIGIRNEAGILNASTIAKIAKMSEALRRLPGIAAPDVLSLSTATSAHADGESVAIAPLFESLPDGSLDINRLRERLNATPMFSERLISKDARVTAIYVPLEHGNDGRNVVPLVQKLVAAQGGPEEYYITGDPVVQETFGLQMFGAMGILGPLSGAIMLGLAFLLFRSWPMAVSVMAVAMLAVTWSMGLIIGLGFPVHIMTSMSPVFLMAIATDSVHVFNEFSWRRREMSDHCAAIIETLRVTRRPLLFTDITTAVAFVSLLFSAFAPVRVFGLCVAFGTLALLLLSFSVVPAILALTPATPRGGEKGDASSRVGALARWLAGLGARHPRRTLLVVGVLVLASGLGMTKLRVNNNQIDWFKQSSPVRQADTLLNRWLGGTSLAYVIASSTEVDFFKDPAALRYVEGLQAELQKLPTVGKTYSVVDQLKQVNRVLHNGDPAESRLPDSREKVAETLFLISTSNRSADADNVIDPSAKCVNIWLQLRTWDVAAMREVAEVAARYQRNHASGITLRPAGMAYLNLMWNEEVLGDMMRGFAFSLIAVFAILALNFRSLKWAALSYAPLVLTITVIYGVVGLVGKDFDMPICVMSCLSLGMAVDFSIHFIARFRQRLDSRYAESSNRQTRTQDVSMLVDALMWTAERPGVGIIKNAALFSGAFSVMLLASLRPYVTVGAFMVSMMVLAAVFTLSVLPAIIVTLGPRFMSRQVDSHMPSAAGDLLVAETLASKV